jgi:tellurite resistance protein
MSSTQREPTKKEALWIARAMARVSAVDGVDVRERALIEGFLEDISSDESFAKLVRAKFDVKAARRALKADMRELLIESCWLVALADQKVSSSERKLINDLAASLDVSPERVIAIRERVIDSFMRELAHVHNVEALAQIANDLRT